MIRDAACYISWCLARNVQVALGDPAMALLSGQLLVAAITDREIQVRRAAAAAFQELAGRKVT